MPEILPFTMTCFFCDEAFPYEPHAYGGRYIQALEVYVCNRCYAANSAGIGPRYEERMLTHLKGRNLPVPDRNKKGLIPLR